MYVLPSTFSRMGGRAAGAVGGAAADAAGAAGFIDADDSGVALASVFGFSFEMSETAGVGAFSLAEDAAFDGFELSAATGASASDLCAPGFAGLDTVIETTWSLRTSANP